ncbi:MAG: amidohydrolase family protein [Clostridia bacterium]|nr:amidohydrolase family protein [Clostridia bacterium]
MIIDFHAHIFPERIAAKTISLLSEKGGYPAHSDGTVNGLLCEMERAGVDLAVTLPVLTSPHQFDSVNRFAAEVNRAFADKERRLLSFGGIHPACEDIEGKMDYLAECGFLGVKIHPDYQETFIDDEGYLRIVESAKRNDMIVVTHAGPDPAYRDRPVRCTPRRFKELIRAVPHAKLVLAHMGGGGMADEVISELCGEDVYFDTAYVLPFLDAELFRKLLHLHGEDKILFATDSPWSSAKESVNIIRSYSLGRETEEKIFYKNAARLLKG